MTRRARVDFMAEAEREAWRWFFGIVATICAAAVLAAAVMP